MLVTWPPHGQNGFLVKFWQGGYSKFKFTTFFGQVHFQCILGTKCTCHFKIICQSSQGHILYKESIDFLGHCSCLLGKVKDNSFKCKLTEIVTWAFWYFWFQCKVNRKIGIWSPMSSYMCCKGTQNWFFGPNLFHHRNFKSYHTSTGSHIFSNVKGHMSAILNNLNLHLELVWIWVEHFCSCTLHLWLKSNDFFLNYQLCMIFYHSTYCCLENFQEKFENISVSLNFKFILNFLVCIHWFLDLNFDNFQPYLVSISCLDLGYF